MRIGKGVLCQKVIEKLSDDYSLNLKAASAIVDAVFDATTELMLKNGKVNIPKFGTFVVVNTKARVARNPKTGEKINVPAKKRAKFRASIELSRIVNEK